MIEISFISSSFICFIIIRLCHSFVLFICLIHLFYSFVSFICFSKIHQKCFVQKWQKQKRMIYCWKINQHEHYSFIASKSQHKKNFQSIFVIHAFQYYRWVLLKSMNRWVNEWILLRSINRWVSFVEIDEFCWNR